MPHARVPDYITHGHACITAMYLVPFVEGEAEVFLKTIIPSRKATNIYLRLRREDG